MSDLTQFTFQDRVLRITDQAGEPWFVLKDVLSAMGTSRTTYQSVESINQNLGDGYTKDIPIADAIGRMQSTLIAAEPAVTFLVSRSNTEGGRKLNRFIHTEVLPAIRKTGRYQAPVAPAPVAPPAPPVVPSRMIPVARYAELLEAEVAMLKQRLASLPDTPAEPPLPAVRRVLVSDEEVATVVDLFNRGRNKAEIARAIGRHPRVVGRILDRATRASAAQLDLSLTAAGGEA